MSYNQSFRAIQWLAQLGAFTLATLAGLGAFARFMGSLFVLLPRTLARPRLILEQIHFIGNYSLLIIGVSGLFVGFVLGLQGYYTLSATVLSKHWGCWWRFR
jgi:phospholipid/cholesterol/gamma-HCH transport system permease protein